MAWLRGLVEVATEFLRFPLLFAEALAEPSIPAIIVTFLVFYTTFVAATRGPVGERVKIFIARWAVTIFVALALYNFTHDEHAGYIAVYGVPWALILYKLEGLYEELACNDDYALAVTVAGAIAVIALLIALGEYLVAAAWVIASLLLLVVVSLARP